MPKGPQGEKRPKQDDPKQSKRFIEAAKAVGGSNDPTDFDKAFKRVTGKGKAP